MEGNQPTIVQVIEQLGLMQQQRAVAFQQQLADQQAAFQTTLTSLATALSQQAPSRNTQSTAPTAATQSTLCKVPPELDEILKNSTQTFKDKLLKLHKSRKYLTQLETEQTALNGGTYLAGYTEAKT